jgi:hypothetical protein
MHAAAENSERRRWFNWFPPAARRFLQKFRLEQNRAPPVDYLVRGGSSVLPCLPSRDSGVQGLSRSLRIGCDRRSKPDRRSLFERLSPCDSASSSDRVSAPLRRSLPERLSKSLRLSWSLMDASPHTLSETWDGRRKDRAGMVNIHRMAMAASVKSCHRCGHALASVRDRYCCKSRKSPGDNFPAKGRHDRRPSISVLSIALRRSPVSLRSGDEVPHIFTRKSRLRPREFLISGAKRLLQQYR